MNLIVVTRTIAIVGIALGLVGILLRINSIMNRPFKQDLARQRGSPMRGILYAFTLGMAPWEKESARIHWIAYLRGIIFHVGIFLTFGVLLASPWLSLLPAWLIGAAIVVTGAGTLFDLAGVVMRLSEPDLRVLSQPDDYASVIFTSLFMGLGCASLAWPIVLPAFYVITGLMAIYIPFSKIRHCVYFFYSRFFFGKGFGYRGVIGHSKSKYAE